MLDAFGKLLGLGHYISSCNPNDFFGEYAEGFYRKLLVCMNECEGKDTFDFEGKIKSFISDATISMNPKYLRATTINNYARTIIFTNKPNPFPIDVRSKERRFVAFKCTEKYLEKKYGDIFWTKLVAHFARPEFTSALYDYMNTKDISHRLWKSRPITECYLEMCRQYVPAEALFLEKYFEEIGTVHTLITRHPYDSRQDIYECAKDYDKNMEVKTSDLYKEYTDFCDRFGFKAIAKPNIGQFTGKLLELEIGFSKHKTNETTVLRYNMLYAYKTMIDKKWIIKAEDEAEWKEDADVGGEDFTDYFEM